MERNQGQRDPRNKLRIGNTGNAGEGNPAINALLDVIGGVVGNNSIGELKRVLEERCVAGDTHSDAWVYEARRILREGAR